MSPANAAGNIAPDVTLKWRPGRLANQHKVYVSADPNAVINGTVTPYVVSQPSYSPMLELGRTYYWRVDEVNNAETPASWSGDIWSFTVPAYLVVDDFESYNATTKQIYRYWVDGMGYGTAGTPDYYAGNGTGAEIGDLTTASYMELTTRHGGAQALPYKYNNAKAGAQPYSESTLAIGKNWTSGAPQTLVVWFYGDLANASEKMYAKVNSTKIVYTGANADLKMPRWTQWNVDLSTIAASVLQNVTSLTIGFEKAGAVGGAGKMLFDDIRLYREAPALPTEEVWVEAESGTISAPFATFTELAGAFGGQYVGKADGSGNNSNSAPTDAIATYTFTVSGGVYRLDCRIWCVGGSNAFWLQIPGVVIKTVTGADATLTGGWVDGNNITSGAYWHWAYFVSDDNTGDPIVEFALPAGTYTLKLGNRDDGTMLDAFVITKVRDL
jgi:hypothetical protein